MVLSPVELEEIGGTMLQNDLYREFKRRQVSMFPLACAIGTDSSSVSGAGRARGGPRSLLISYNLVGATVFFVMTALGEMAKTILPMKKGFGEYAIRKIDPAFAFAIPSGWARGYFLGSWASMCQACFAYAGTEGVSMTFGEVLNPRKTIPHTVRQTFLRIVCFYIRGVIVLGMCVPYDNERLVGITKTATSAARIGVFLEIINAARLVFILSAAITKIYVASKCVYG
ncbi:uncharacterized protein Z519_08699 [Cladophialophora bantiana CBS 173.52]|uniref:Amino acid permease/ SLC12A domain-containing protein n=1 Tax=Cladophialophora bantiana (strain ATCC 10958 / CBS 173.52 / CDC B-1940 / NIH 8579) TaxID=1442370 RepID=A0A0D2ELR2_CLAB1|nr:uncharacterized protein Z519_08699 [Cladophialophora bantiana CBS 173.52]KIW90916.1 hypothetical protein Z519_08699 [Cladophialophora bantiana CBS 173.52]